MWTPPRLYARGVPRSSRRSALWQSSLRLDPAAWRPGAASRCTLALALALGFGVLSGHPAWGVALALGAFNAGLLSLNGVYRSKLRQMLSTGLVMALMALLAELVSNSPLLTVLLVALASGALTLYAEAGPEAASLALQGTITVIVISGLGLGPQQALPTAALVLAGVLLQLLMLALLWPLDPRQPERRAVAGVYASLARYLDGFPLDPGRALPDDSAFQNARSVLDDAARAGWRAGHAPLLAALRGAEGLRAALIALARADRQMRAAGPAESWQARVSARLLARLLRGVARNLRARHADALSGGALRGLDEVLERLPAEGVSAEQARHASALRLIRHLLLGLERSAPAHGPPQAVPPPTPTALKDLLAQAGAWPYALRYALALGGATALYQFVGLSHGYWLPLSVAVILRPDYFTTLTRGLARFAGTLTGVALAELVGLTQPGGGLLSLLLLASAWLAYALLQVGYAPFSLAVTLYVVFSLEAAGVSGGSAVLARLGFTLAGGLLALLAFLVWPQWRAPGALAALRRAAQAQAEWGRSVLALARGQLPPDHEGRRAAARRSRVEAEQAVQAASAEPIWAVPEVRRQALADTLARLSENAALLVSLQLEAQAEHPPADLAARVERAVGVAEGLVEEGRPHKTAP